MTKPSWLGPAALVGTLVMAACSTDDSSVSGNPNDGPSGGEETPTPGGSVPPGDAPPSDDGLGMGTTGGAGPTGGNAGTGAVTQGPDGQNTPPGDPGTVTEGGPTTLLPARIRRLTNAEYDASVQVLLETGMRPSVEFSFPPDARQGPSNSPAGAAFTVNDAQRVDPVLAGKLDTAAQALVAEARASGKLAELSPCTDTSAAGGEACAEAFLRSFGDRAYRRPVSEDEVTDLVFRSGSAYHVGADGYLYEDGIDLLARVVLQTPAFLYVTELGDGAPGDEPIELTANEIAASLSYLLTSGPPDAELLARATAGELATPTVREAEARRLLETSAGRERLVDVVREWLGIDDVARREKAQNVYPDFVTASQAMENESRAFIEEVLYESTGTLTELLTADWTIAEAPLASVYGLTPAAEGQRTSLLDSGRRGILNQGAFLSVFATNNGSHPVFRGVAVMRRVACLDTPDPGALGIIVSFPASDTSRTTRVRFEDHAQDPGCATCHTTIDALGFTLENFDGMGKSRTMENGLPIDTTVTIEANTDFDGSYANSAELVEALAASESVKACLARQLFRSAAGRSDDAVRAVEDGFVELWQGLPAERRDHLVDVLVAYVASPLFVERRAE
jgi:hypothetical protein